MSDYIEDISNILYEMDLVVDKTNERLEEPLPRLQYTPASIKIERNNDPFYYGDWNLIKEGDTILGRIKIVCDYDFQTIHAVVNIGNEFITTRMIRVDRPSLFLEEVETVLRMFFPLHILC